MKKKLLILLLLAFAFISCNNNNKEAEYYFLKGEDFRHNKDYYQALAYYDKAITLKPNYKTAYFEKAYVLSELGSDDKSIECYMKVIEISNESTGAYNNIAIIEDNRSNSELALEYLNKEIMIDENIWNSYYRRARILYDKEEYSNALIDIDRAIQRAKYENNDIKIMLYEARAKIKNKLNKRKEAIIDLYYCFKLDNKYLNEFTDTLLENGYAKEVEYIITKNYNSSYYYYLMGKIREKQKKPREAIYYYEKQLNNNYLDDAEYRIGLAYRSCGENTKAERCFLNLYRAKSKYFKEASKELLKSDEKYIDLIYYDIVLRDNQEPVVILECFKVYVQKGVNNRAMELINILIEKIGNGYGYYLRGDLKYRLGDNYGAMKDFNRAIELEYEDTELYYKRGKINKRFGKNEEACEDWSKAGELGDMNSYDLIKKYCK